jgi:YlmC/YmxH family sporulation protein
MHSAVISAIITFSELKNKEVINLYDGSLLGCVGDLEFNSATGEICAIILPGNGLLASLSPKNRIVIPWHDIERIGKDTILVRFNCEIKNS